MDGLRIDEHSRVHQLSSLSSSKNIQENAAKTPRRGLGLMINEIKTPGSRSKPGSVASTIRKASRAPVFEVFEDVSDKLEVLEKQEDEEKCNSPIEGVSRLSLSSIGFEFNEEDNIILHNEEDDVIPLGDEPKEDVSNLYVANLHNEEWDECPPIEIASRFDESVENFKNYYDADVDSLYEENAEKLERLPSDESLAKLTREEVEQWIEESELNEHDLETF